MRKLVRRAGLGAQGQAHCGGGRMWEEQACWCPALQQELADPEKDSPRGGWGTEGSSEELRWVPGGQPAPSHCLIPRMFICAQQGLTLVPLQELPKVAPKSEFSLITEDGDWSSDICLDAFWPPRPPLLTEEEFKALSWLCSFSLESFSESQRQRTK